MLHIAHASWLYSLATIYEVWFGVCKFSLSSPERKAASSDGKSHNSWKFHGCVGVVSGAMCNKTLSCVLKRRGAWWLEHAGWLTWVKLCQKKLPTESGFVRWT